VDLRQGFGSREPIYMPHFDVIEGGFLFTKTLPKKLLEKVLGYVEDIVREEFWSTFWAINDSVFTCNPTNPLLILILHDINKIT